MTLRAGVIGLGVGMEHADAYRAHPDCELAALCDMAPERLYAARRRQPDVTVTTDADEILDDPGIDVVSVASYDSFHYEQVRRALEQGKHVFVEKPLCLAAHEAGELRSLLRAHPELRLSCNLPLRLSPRFQLVKRWVEQGRFGSLYYLEGDYDYGRLWKLTEGWRGDLERYSVTLGGAVHVIDLLLWLTGRRPLRASAHGNRIATEGTKFRFDDFVLATIELDGGVICKVSANFACVHPHFHGVKVFGSEATFVNGLAEATLWTGGDGDPTPEPVTAEYPGVGKGDLIESFVEAILGRGRAVVTEDDVFRTMAVCFAVDEAAASGAAVEIEDLGRAG